MLVDKRRVKIAREDKILDALGDGEDKITVLSEHLIYCTDGQVN